MAEHVNLLWTGGWDSTLRLLQLLLIEKKRVQPHYIMIGARKSTPNEIEAMNRIRQYLFINYPHVKKLLLETFYIDDSILEENDTIQEAFRVLETQNHIGDQYEILARFSKQYRHDDLELCIEDGNFSKNFVQPYLYTNNCVSEPVNKIKSEITPEPIRHIFSGYRFPVIKFSKDEMDRYVKERQWMDIMRMTWMCHRPILGRYPCGACNPCMFVRKDGMGWRIPFPQRILGGLIKKVYNSSITIKFRNLFK